MPVTNGKQLCCPSIPDFTLQKPQGKVCCTRFSVKFPMSRTGQGQMKPASLTCTPHLTIIPYTQYSWPIRVSKIQNWPQKLILNHWSMIWGWG